VVQPRRGAFTEIVERTGGGVLVEPDDAESLADGLHRMWADPGLRQETGDRGFEGVRAVYSVAFAADRLLEVYRDLVSGSTIDRDGRVDRHSIAVS
jgi:glycosyltransferase involved in cell wall biosynthesis